MFKDIFYPTPQNAFIWLSAVYLVFLLYLGKVAPIAILFTYFLETIIIGVFNALKMYWSAIYGKHKGGVGLILFFVIHYGFFVAIQSIFGFALFSLDNSLDINTPHHIIDNYITIFQLEGMLYTLPAIIFTHSGKFITDFIRNKKYVTFSPSEIMFKPYVRIFIQQFVVLISFFFIVFMDAGLIAALLLIIFRLVVDLFMESIKEKSEILDVLAEKLANEKTSKADIKKQLINFTE